jgi:prepilin-type N-terminal cleavage/methylation domain-containing protein
MRRRSCKVASTLVELLVVIAIIGILIALPCDRNDGKPIDGGKFQKEQL